MKVNQGMCKLGVEATVYLNEQTCERAGGGGGGGAFCVEEEAVASMVLTRVVRVMSVVKEMLRRCVSVSDMVVRSS